MIAVFDGHNDALTRADYAPLTEARPGRHIDLDRMRAGGMRGGIFAVFAADDPAGPDPFEHPIARDDGVLEFPLSDPIEHGPAAAVATVAAGRLHALERAGAVRIARAIGDIDAAFNGADGPPVTVLHLEGAEAIDPGLEALELWYAAGLRSLGPVWSRPTAFGHGVPFIFPSSPDTGPGLTEPGLTLVDRCAELGIAVDLSHLNEAGFWDVARLDRGPLIASHSGAHQLCPASRNLTDEQLDAIAASGGLVGIVFASLFLRTDFADTADTPISVIVDHARYVADRIGVEHVALGSDFDGATVPGELGDVAGLPRLLDALASDGGFTDAELELIAWRNWRRVLESVVALMDQRLTELLDELYARSHERDERQSNGLDRWRNVEPETARLMAVLVRALAPSRLLELGSSNGYSTIWLADAARAVGGHLVTVEIDPLRAAKANDNLRRAGFDDEVGVRVGDAADVLAESDDRAWDFIFLDAERPAYASYWPDLVRVLAHRGMLVVDNVISHASELAEFRQLVRGDRRVCEALAPTGAGALLVAREPLYND